MSSAALAAPGAREGNVPPEQSGSAGSAAGVQTPEVLLPQEGTAAWSLDRAFPPRCPSSPRSEVGPCDGPAPAQPASLGTDNPLLAPPVPGADHVGQDVRLLPSGEPAPPWAPASERGAPLSCCPESRAVCPTASALCFLFVPSPLVSPLGLAALKVWLSGRAVQEGGGDSVKAEAALGQAAARWAVSGSRCGLEPAPRAVCRVRSCPRP